MTLSGKWYNIEYIIYITLHKYKYLYTERKRLFVRGAI